MRAGTTHKHGFDTKGNREETYQSNVSNTSPPAPAHTDKPKSAATGSAAGHAARKTAITCAHPRTWPTTTPGARCDIAESETVNYVARSGWPKSGTGHAKGPYQLRVLALTQFRRPRPAGHDTRPLH